MKRIILVGKSGSGKDYARTFFEKTFNAKYALSYTTRPPRENEVNGKDYYFVSKEQFEDMISKDLFYEYVKFNDWYYGTSKQHFNECSVFIMTPKGIKSLTEADRQNSIVIYFNIDEEIRKERIKARKGNADSLERRLIADKEDFKDFRDFNFMIDNPYFSNDSLKFIWNNYKKSD